MSDPTPCMDLSGVGLIRLNPCVRGNFRAGVGYPRTNPGGGPLEVRTPGVPPASGGGWGRARARDSTVSVIASVSYSDSHRLLVVRKYFAAVATVATHKKNLEAPKLHSQRLSVCARRPGSVIWSSLAGRDGNYRPGFTWFIPTPNKSIQGAGLGNSTQLRTKPRNPIRVP